MLNTCKSSLLILRHGLVGLATSLVLALKKEKPVHTRGFLLDVGVKEPKPGKALFLTGSALRLLSLAAAARNDRS